MKTLDSKKLKGEVNVRYLQKYDKCAILRNFPREYKTICKVTRNIFKICLKLPSKIAE